jgi:arabinogalactan endo-1,4-beta-galactosidase
MRNIKFIFILLLSFGLFSCCSKTEENDDNTDNENPQPPVVSFYRGADLSFLPMLENTNTIFFDKEGNPSHVLDLMKQRGMNVVRIRLWHMPEDVHSSFEEVKSFSDLVKSKGLQTWLTVHYSDTWADPGNQSKPAAWSSLSFEILKDSVFQYTKKIVQQMQPDMIQIGNETNNGFLWPDGKLSENKQQYLQLVQQGIFAVREFGGDAKIMLQHAGTNGADWFFSETNSLDFDMIGLSYYPWWHGNSLEDLGNNISQLKSKYSKEVLIAETAYPFTLGWNDWTNNIVGNEDQLIPAYPATEAGQKAFFEAFTARVKEVDGMGYCYWAPEWIAYDGPESPNGSPWENLCIFNFDSKETPALEVFFKE